MAISPKVPRVACVVAFVVSGLVAVAALIGEIILLPAAAVPLVAGVGIQRRRVWSAYGFALYITGQLSLIPFVLIRAGAAVGNALDTIVSAVFMAALALLFFFAGRSLAAAGSRRGRALPWVALSIVATAPVLFVQAFVIPTGAMEDTFLIGDRVLVRRFPLPRFGRDDIVVFKYPVDRRQTFVKRIIGVPGDRIRISEKMLYRNGTKLREPYAVHKTAFTDPYRDNFPSELNSSFAEAAREMLENHVVNGEVVVPEHSYFVLGDNRDSSLDSRYWGFVSFDDLVGKPILIYVSEEQPPDALLNPRPAWPRRIRWERLFRLVSETRRLLPIPDLPLGVSL